MNEPKTAQEFFEQGNGKYSLGDFSGAIEDYDKAIELDPKCAYAYYNRGVANKNLGNYEEAILDYDKAIELDPKYVDTYNGRGIANENLGNYEKAILDYDKAIELDPKYAHVYNNRGVTNCDLGNYEEAILDYDKAIELDPKCVDAYNGRGNANNDLGNYEEALLDYNKVIELDPKYVDAYNNRGVANKNLGNYEEAILDYDKAIELDPKYAYAYYNRGILKNRIGSFPEALDDMNQCLKLNNKYFDAWYFIQEELISSNTERRLCRNRLRYLNLDLALSEMWRKKQKKIDLESEVLGQFDPEEEGYRYFADWLKQRLIEGGKCTPSARLRYQIVSLLYFLADRPEEAFSVIDKYLDIPAFGALSPLEHYFFVQSAWRILESKEKLVAKMEDAQEDGKEIKECASYELAFAECIHNTDTKTMEGLFEMSEFFPFYKNFRWEVDRERLMETLTVGPIPYTIKHGAFDAERLLKTLLWAHAHQKPLKDVITIEKRDMNAFASEIFGRAVQKSMERFRNNFSKKQEETDGYIGIMRASSYAECGILVKAWAQEKEDLESVILALFDRMQKRLLKKEEFYTLSAYAFYRYIFCLHKDAPETKKNIVKMVVGVMAAFVAKEIPQYGMASFYVGVSPTVIDFVFSKYLNAKEFPDFSIFSKDVSEGIESLMEEHF